MVLRIAQVSDAHLSPRVPAFEGNFDSVAQAVRDAAPDLMLASGDLSLDGADHEEDLRHAFARHAAIGPALLAIPGNHDVGDTTALPAAQPADAARVARWVRHAGGLGFVQDAPGWRIIGLDTQSLGEEAGAAQWEMLERAAADAGGRRLAIFGHKPLAVNLLDDPTMDYWPVLPAPRRRLLALLRPAFYASGHVHQWRDHAPDGLRQVWAPATSFILGDRYQTLHGEKCLGWVEHVLHPDGRAEHHLRRVPAAVPHDLGEMPAIYGPQPALA